MQILAALRLLWPSAALAGACDRLVLPDAGEDWVGALREAGLEATGRLEHCGARLEQGTGGWMLVVRLGPEDERRSPVPAPDSLAARLDIAILAASLLAGAEPPPADAAKPAKPANSLNADSAEDAAKPASDARSANSAIGAGGSGPPVSPPPPPRHGTAADSSPPPGVVPPSAAGVVGAALEGGPGSEEDPSGVEPPSEPLGEAAAGGEPPEGDIPADEGLPGNLLEDDESSTDILADRDLPTDEELPVDLLEDDEALTDDLLAERPGGSLASPVVAPWIAARLAAFARPSAWPTVNGGLDGGVLFAGQVALGLSFDLQGPWAFTDSAIDRGVSYALGGGLGAGWAPQTRPVAPRLVGKFLVLARRWQQEGELVSTLVVPVAVLEGGVALAAGPLTFEPHLQLRIDLRRTELIFADDAVQDLVPVALSLGLAVGLARGKAAQK